MKTFAIGLTVVALSLASACGGDDKSPSVAAPSASATTSTGGGAGTGTVLTGTVGSKDQPNAFSITLVDATGANVTTLPAGKYQIKVSDLSKIHNFHLKGGTIDVKTKVSETEETTFNVDLTAGSYVFKCDPHRQMSGEFTVS